MDSYQDLTPWPRFFDLGQGTDSYLYCTPVGEERAGGCRVRMTAKGYNQETGPAAFRVSQGQWVHLATVLDAGKKTLSLYVNGVRVGQSSDVPWSLTDILNQDNPSANKLYIGKSLSEGDAYFGGKLYDVRFYSIALTDAQVAVIHHNAISDEDMAVTESKTEKKPEVQQEQGGRILVKGLTGVPDIAVETTVGHLPHLPYTIPGTYRDNATGPHVRVIWPAPTDNSDVSKAGTYTVTGPVPGTSFKSKAASPCWRSLPLNGCETCLKPCALGQVTLVFRQRGARYSVFKNRNKFIQGWPKPPR
jgi:hypothetical protein